MTPQADPAGDTQNTTIEEPLGDRILDMVMFCTFIVIGVVSVSVQFIFSSVENGGQNLLITYLGVAAFVLAVTGMVLQVDLRR